MGYIPESVIWATFGLYAVIFIAANQQLYVAPGWQSKDILRLRMGITFALFLELLLPSLELLVRYVPAVSSFTNMIPTLVFWVLLLVLSYALHKSIRVSREQDDKKMGASSAPPLGRHQRAQRSVLVPGHSDLFRRVRLLSAIHHRGHQRLLYRLQPLRHLRCLQHAADRVPPLHLFEAHSVDDSREQSLTRSGADSGHSVRGQFESSHHSVDGQTHRGRVSLHIADIGGVGSGHDLQHHHHSDVD